MCSRAPCASATAPNPVTGRVTRDTLELPPDMSFRLRAAWSAFQQTGPQFAPTAAGVPPAKAKPTGARARGSTRSNPSRIPNQLFVS